MNGNSIADWITEQSVPLIIIFGIGWFVYAKLWPWLTETYIPQQQALQREILSSVVQIAEHMENASRAFELFLELCRKVRIETTDKIDQQ